MSPGDRMYALAERLFPICRSITGNGLRETLAILGEHIPLTLFEVPSGTEVFDWTVPREWNIRDAWIKDPSGAKIVDFRASNLHVMGYSVPVRGKFALAELKTHLHSLPDQPDWIPYRSSYYKDAWGFCLSHNQLLGLPEGEYEACIDSTLADGHLTYAECFLPGKVEEEVIVFAHTCHPSLANDNLSGLAVAVEMAKSLKALGGMDRHYSYRFLFCPTVIGPITWLARNEANVHRIRHGLVLALLGDSGALTYKKSRRGDAAIDRAMAHVLKHAGAAHSFREFTPYGYDERQFCSPGFNLPVGCLMRSPNGTFPEYHSSGDNLGFIKPRSLEESLNVCLEAIAVIEGDGKYLNQNPKCEPRLGKRGIYEGLKGKANLSNAELSLLWILNFSDGGHSLLDIAERAGYPFASIRAAADVLEGCGLLKPAPPVAA